MPELLPLFVNLAGRRVVLVGGGVVAASKVAALKAAGADVTVIAPEVHPDIELAGVSITRRGFRASDLDGAWFVVAAATPEINRIVAEAAEARRLFVNAVDDPMNATAYLSGVVRRDGVTIAISTSGAAPGLVALLRQAFDALLPRELGEWMAEAKRLRRVWRRNRVPIANRRPLLLEALNQLYSLPRVEARARDVGADGHEQEGGRPSGAGAGHVSLVGAGPGDPGLLTREAVRRLRAADLVLYDALVDDRVLRLARHAHWFFVGKRAGRHSLSQQDIHAIMIRAAGRGRRVVRLKGGDPFVFGRGGEEAIALLKAGVSVDVVPGVTSAVAAPALAGIPVTHRGVSSAVLIVSGHDEQAFADAVGRVKPSDTTLVVMMGSAHRARLGSILLDRDWRPGTPAALIADASRPGQQVWRGTLAELAAGGAAVASGGPALVIVGEVAAVDLSAAAEQEPTPAQPASMRGH